jgi:spore coat polysaccharide biosynthesis predicted glycosyltransferase SpsG/CMP-N-acetylneuraminic acid synthetase
VTTTRSERVWYLVPARGGSRGIPRKNVRLLAGKPLIRHVLDTIAGVAGPSRIILSTDDDEIASHAQTGSLLHSRSAQTASDAATLDEVSAEVAAWLVERHDASESDILVTVQPTSPFVSVQSLRAAVERIARGDVDTVLTVKDDRHLRWTRDDTGRAVPLFSARVNRQALPVVLAETGAVVATTIGHVLTQGTRIGRRVELIEVDGAEGLDIDDYIHWAAAEYISRRLRVLLRADSSREIGYGHAYRAMAVAEALAEHDVTIVARSDGEYATGYEFLESRGSRLAALTATDNFVDMVAHRRPHIVINDILDTDADYVRALKNHGAFVVNFEDLGSGLQEAHLVVNDLYPDTVPSTNHWYGLRYAIVNPHFDRTLPRREPGRGVGRMLLAFGGADPSKLTALSLRAVHEAGFTGELAVVLGPGFSYEAELRELIDSLNAPFHVEICRNVRNMAALMSTMDLAVTSAGRTVTELMTVGVPTIAICQNMREMRHSHASSAFGVINLGLGELLSASAVARHVRLFMDDARLRHDMTERMRRAVSDRSNRRIVDDIVTEYRNWRERQSIDAT